MPANMWGGLMAPSAALLLAGNAELALDNIIQELESISIRACRSEMQVEIGEFSVTNAKALESAAERARLVNRRVLVHNVPGISIPSWNSSPQSGAGHAA
ncbi:hypothetical protein [Streptomyces sp. NBC_00690]|uniref:hypothetical protein n=1 Tax=Streptomyces sp. NBC_00690 TaxID=2975808 RepID=UPI002E2DE9A0|nr:hypothetical protein [Streptomyces sp. NBC_00690]